MIQGDSMPYASIEALPESVRRGLPSHAQSIYRGAFNNAWVEYASAADREARAHRVAWAAVKRLYHKTPLGWVLREDRGRG